MDDLLASARVAPEASSQGTILVTGTGGGVGQSILKSLCHSRYRPVAVDADPLATGLYTASKGYTVPYAAAKGYIDRLLDIAKAECVSIIFPGLDAELPILAANAHRFLARGITIVVGSSEVVDICDDKLATHDYLKAHGLNVPLTYPLSQEVIHRLSFPIVLKPRKGGARSRGVFVVRDLADYEHRLTTLDVTNYVAQEYLQGEEFTCGTVTLEGVCFGPIIMRRVLRDGDTYKASVVFNEVIERTVRKAALALKPFGPCNFQLRVVGNEPYIFEINARCSGTTHCRTLAGFNEPLMVADWLTMGKRPTFDIQEISVLRYWKELVVPNNRIKRLQQEGVVVGENGSL